jgi:hypothetical protein
VIVPKRQAENEAMTNATTKSALPTKTYTVHVRAAQWFADYTVEARNERHAQSIALGLAYCDCPNNLRHWLRAVC